MNNLPITSLSLDVVALIVFGLALVWYVYKHGVKQIVMLHIALYASLAITPLINLNISEIGPIAGTGVLFLALVIIIWFSIRQGPIGKSLGVSKSNKNIQYLYTVSVLASFLSMLFPFLRLSGDNTLSWIENSLFTQSYLTIVWYSLPLVILYFVKSIKKK